MTYHHRRSPSPSAQGGGANDYGQRAHHDLIMTRGAGFRKEKNKKKRGSYRGGEITVSRVFDRRAAPYEYVCSLDRWRTVVSNLTFDHMRCVPVNVGTRDLRNVKVSSDGS